ncbi:hypothetical protein RHIZO_00492 [Rhizobiaceae bacterium]|nr:hypothetical protein RHIZO_00492 [Rhizobiaceae bacterium]
MSNKLLAALTDGVVAIKQALPAFGKPRPIGKGEVATTWREVTIGADSFRVLTLEDPK